MVELGLCKWFGEYIGWVFIHQYIFDHNFPIFNSLSDEMIPDINVLGPSVEFVIF